MSRLWLLLLAIVVVIFIGVVWTARGSKEGFMTVDSDTVAAQRQQLQFEGERRYNDMARTQSPGAPPIDPDAVNAALQTGIAVPTSKTPSLLGIIGSSLGLGAADNGAGKVGSSVEQTGVIAQKIAFCESLGTDCSALQDPRAAECGICLNGGTDSAGRAHKGGLFISSDDQLRNSGGQQTPTIGTCPAANFVTDPTWCNTRSNELACELKSILTDSDQCGICFGGASAGKNGLVYMGPKGRAFDATLAISHPGFHADNNGVSFTVTRADGTSIGSLTSSNTGNALDPRKLTLAGIREGDQLVITIRGPPVVWAGYLSNASGTRRLSLDVGVQGVSPTGAFEVAGDAYSAMVTNVMNGIYGWSAYQADLPRTVMWYQRQSNVVPASVVNASYVAPSGQSFALPTVSKVLGTGTGAIVSQGVNAANLEVADPDNTVQKNLILTQDDGNTVVYPDNTQVDPTKFMNTVTLYFTVPATLADPLGPTDLADCAAGPVITTTAGAAAFGSHSCYNADGSPNLSTGCLSELYQSAGGTQAGTLNPVSNTGPLLNAVASANSITDVSKVTLDMVTNFLGLQSDIVRYQADATGKPVPFAAYRTATQNLLGRTPGNPCDTPTAKAGSFTPECLDYLWRTSGNVGAEPILPNGDPIQLPYQYCTAAGSLAPLQADGTPNQAGVSLGNQLGDITQVRAFYKSIHDTATNGANTGVSPDQLNTYMQACMGVNYQPPPQPPWDQCMPEVFAVRPNGTYDATPGTAEAVCKNLGATLASTAQMIEARMLGAEWCSAGWTSDNSNALYPMQSTIEGCGGGPGVKIFEYQYLENEVQGTGGNLGNGAQSTALAGVNCFGTKPPVGTPTVMNFNASNNIWKAPPKIPRVGMTISLALATSLLSSPIVARHANFMLIPSQFTLSMDFGLTPSADYQLTQDGSFKVVAANNGLGANYVSFEAINFPNYFLRHQNGAIYLNQQNPADATFNDDSTFAIVPPVATGVSPLGFSIQLSTDPTLYISANITMFGSSISVGPAAGANSVWRIYPTLNGHQNSSQ